MTKKANRAEILVGSRVSTSDGIPFNLFGGPEIIQNCYSLIVEGKTLSIIKGGDNKELVIETAREYAEKMRGLGLRMGDYEVTDGRRIRMTTGERVRTGRLGYLYTFEKTLRDTLFEQNKK